MSGWDAYLDPGERVLWEGAPSARLFLLHKADIVLVPFSLLWMGGVLIAAPTMVFGNTALFVKFFGLFFLAVGAYAVIGRFLIDFLIRRRTRYALSSRRAFIATSAFGRSLSELPITPELQVHLKDGRLGSVTLGEPRGINAKSPFDVWQGTDGSFTFRAIDTPSEVYALVRQIKKGGME